MAASIDTRMQGLLESGEYKPIIQTQLAQGAASSQSFDPASHIQYEPPSQIIKMADIGYPDNLGVSPVAVSQPFRLFSKDAIMRMRQEIFSPNVMKHCKYSSNIAACQLRGYSSNEDTLNIISNIAGIKLVPEMDFEIGHVNISVKSKAETQAELEVIERQKRGIASPWQDDKPVVGWHVDSYPFVCVLMLSDCTNMVGGETALRTGKGEVIKVRGPEMGCAVVLQGRYICHEALRAFGAQERITMVTSFRPKSAHLADDSVLTTVRPISNLSDLYSQFGEYRLEILEERLRTMLKATKNRRLAGKQFDTRGFKAFLKTQLDFLTHTDQELVPEEEVRVGYIEEMEFPDVALEKSSQPRRMAKLA